MLGGLYTGYVRPSNDTDLPTYLVQIRRSRRRRHHSRGLVAVSCKVPESRGFLAGYQGAAAGQAKMTPSATTWGKRDVLERPCCLWTPTGGRSSRLPSGSGRGGGNDGTRVRNRSCSTARPQGLTCANAVRIHALPCPSSRPHLGSSPGVKYLASREPTGCLSAAPPILIPAWLARETGFLSYS